MGPLSQLFADPIVQSVVAPLLVAAILAGVLGFGFGRTIGPRVAAAAVPAGFLVSYWSTVGWPAFPPVSSTQKIAYITILGASIGAFLDARRLNDGIKQFGIQQCLWTATIVCWLGWRVPFTDASGSFGWVGFSPHWRSGIFTLIVLWLSGTIGILSMQAQRSDRTDRSVMIVIATIGISLIALIGSSASLAQLSGGLAAATGAFLLWNWPNNRFPFGWSALLGGAGTLLALVSTMVLFTNVSKLALLLIFPVFFANRLAARLPLGAHRVFAPFVLAAVCLVPVALAVLVAYLSSGGGSGYAFNMEVSH